MTTQTQAKPLFAAKLTPPHSLSGRGMRLIIAGTAIAASVPAMIYLSLGAWPIAGFVAVDVLVLFWALSRSMRDGKRFEEVTLWRDQLELRQVDAAGRESLTRFNPHLVKLVVDRDYNERTTGLHLRTANEDIALGTFLGADEKSSFAKAFGTALKRARH